MRIEIDEKRLLEPRGSSHSERSILVAPGDIDIRYRYVPDDILIKFEMDDLYFAIYLEREEWERLAAETSKAKPPPQY